MRRTLADALSPYCRISASLGIAPTDSRVLTWINSASERLLCKGHWIGTTEKATVQVTNQVFTVPPQYATVEQIALSQQPIAIRSQWYEFNPNGWGVINDPTTAAPKPFNTQAVRRNNACTFLDITGTGNKLVFQCDVAADVGLTVLALGYDDSGNWIRTELDSVWSDGEPIILAQTPGTSSANNFSRITGLQLPSGRSGQTWLYTNDGTTATLIGNYQYWETNPSYSRFLLPSLGTATTQLDILGKLAFRPVSNSTDWLIISNLEALRLACMAIKREEENKLDEAALLMNGVRDANTGRVIRDGALTLLDEELQHYDGVGEEARLRTDGAVGDGDPIPALI